MLDKLTFIVRTAAILTLIYAVVYIFSDGTVVPPPDEIRSTVLEMFARAGERYHALMEDAGGFLEHLRMILHL